MDQPEICRFLVEKGADVDEMGVEVHFRDYIRYETCDSYNMMQEHCYG